VLQEACAYGGPWWEQRNAAKEKLTQREEWSKLLKNQRMVSTEKKEQWNKSLKDWGRDSERVTMYWWVEESMHWYAADAH
jgi:hypothetical protein